MLLISLPVHERLDIILDQMKNYLHFAPNAVICLHPSRAFLKQTPHFKSALATFPNVIIHPNPLHTSFGMVLKCHVSNFLYAQSLGIPFSHVAFHASNDLFVRHGVEAYVTRHDFGFFQYDTSLETHLFSQWLNDVQRDAGFKRMMPQRAADVPIYASQIEGSFLPSEAFAEFTALFLKEAWHEIRGPIRYSLGHDRLGVYLQERLNRNPKRRHFFGHLAYPKEEFYFANFFSEAQPAEPYCFMNWKAELEVTQEDVCSIRKGHCPLPHYSEVFTVKRIPRDWNDPLRVWIRNLAEPSLSPSPVC